MDEWVLVQFAEDKIVFVDGTECGKTNVPFIVQRGTHTFDLGEPTITVTRRVFGTTKADPMVIVFEGTDA